MSRGQLIGYFEGGRTRVHLLELSDGRCARMSDIPTPLVLTFNSGSSSLKFGLYRVGCDGPIAQISGEIETLGDGRCRLRASDAGGVSQLDETAVMADPAAGTGRLGAIFTGGNTPAAIGHRIVHG